MVTREYCVAMADYNSWMNAKMYELCGSLSDVNRKRDQRAFFGSIHSTLNHILLCDLSFMASFAGTPQPPDIDGDLHGEFNSLRQQRVLLDRQIADWSRSVEVNWLGSSSTYAHNEDGVARVVTWGFWVAHMFNHQTHHRGQVTTLITQLGYDIGSTDLHMSVPLQSADA